MKRAILAAFMTVVLLSGAAVGCGENLETREFVFTDFYKVDIGSAFQFDIRQSATFSVKITADENVINRVRVVKDDDTLKIGLEPAAGIGARTLRATITMPRLRGMEVSGVSRGTVSGFNSTENLDIEVSGASSLDLANILARNTKFEVSGASKVTGDLAADDTNFDVSGASTIQLKGSAKDIVVKASGASQVKLANYPGSNADVTLSGASSGAVNILPGGRLDVDLSSASNLEYSGERIVMGDINIADASTLTRK